MACDVCSVAHKISPLVLQERREAILRNIQQTGTVQMTSAPRAPRIAPPFGHAPRGARTRWTHPRVMTHRDPPESRPPVALASTARRSTTTRRLDDSGRDSETRAREMAQQAAGAPVTVREAIQVRDEGVESDESVRGERFVARSHLDWID